MRNLKAFCEQQNFWRRLSGKPDYDINNLTQADVNDIVETLDCNMSPENLCCDGEISGAQIARRRRMFTGAYTEISKLAANKGYTLPQTYELG